MQPFESVVFQRKEMLKSRMRCGRLGRLPSMLPRFMVWLVLGCLSGATLSGAPTPGELELSIVQDLLWEGRQRDAEDRLELAAQRFPNSKEVVFLKAACVRSRFDVESASRLMTRVVLIAPRSVEGLCAACVLGIDFSEDAETANYFLGGIAALCRAHPDVLPVRWMAAVMARAVSLEHAEMSWSRLRGVQSFGVDNFKAILSRINGREGPSVLHQTCANLLEGLEALDEAHEHRLTAVKLERAPWSLDGLAASFMQLGRCQEALAACDEALQMVDASRMQLPSDPAASRERAIAEAKNAEADRSAAGYHNRRAEILIEMDDVEGSIRERILASTLDPQGGVADHYLARLYARLGDWEGGRRHAQQAISHQYEVEANSLWLLKMEVRAGVPGAAAALELAESAGNRRKQSEADAKSPIARWFWAVENGDKALFDELAEQVDVNAKSNSKIHATALIVAAQNGNIHLIHELIRRGADLNATDVNGDTALNHAAQFHQPAAMKLLLEAGADASIQDKWKQTPLISAAGVSHNRPAVRLLLERGADPEIATPHGGTPLNYAAGWGDLPIISALLQKGANPNRAAVSDGSTPLISSAQHLHVQAAAAVLNAGANPAARDKAGRTALHCALSATPNRAFIRLLIAHGADPFAADSDGVSCVRRARFLGYEDLALEFEKAAGRTEALNFPVDELIANGERAKRIAELLALPVGMFMGRQPGRTLFAGPRKQSVARAELQLIFGMQNIQELDAMIQGFGAFEPHFSEGFELSEVLMKSAEFIGSRYDQHGENTSAWAIAHRIYFLQEAVEAGFLKREQVAARLARELDQVRNGFSGWDAFAKSFLAGAFRHAGLQFERYAAICLRLTDSRVPGHPWSEGSWQWEGRE
jgi:ankyrin repeat protein/tetratricopeptide (TPR) repeat protein